ncbi:MAG: retropepsin-like aspartic protease [Bacteroidota bacterium]
MSLFKTKENLKKTIIPLRFTDLGDGGCHIIIKARMNGKIARMIIDTGASHTMFDRIRFERFAADATLEKSGQSSTGVGGKNMETHYSMVKKFAIGDMKFMNYEVVILDISHVNQALESGGMRPVDGIIGGDFLSEYRAIIDYYKKEMTLFY